MQLAGHRGGLPVGVGAVPFDVPGADEAAEQVEVRGAAGVRARGEEGSGQVIAGRHQQRSRGNPTQIGYGTAMSFRRAPGQNQASECEEDPVTDKGFITCLWFDDNGEEAANYYMSIFKDSKRGRVSHYSESGMGQPGAVMAVEFEINGQKFLALNGGKQDFGFNESISFQIICADQDEIDYYWGRLTEGGREVACGWVTDKYGVSWQVVPACSST